MVACAKPEIITMITSGFPKNESYELLVKIKQNNSTELPGIEFCYQPFPFFRILFETFAIEANSISNCFRNFCNRIEANSSSHFDSISNSKQLKLGHKFEPQLELELKSNTNSNHSSSSSWNRIELNRIELNRAEIESNWIEFCSRSARARRWPL